MAVDKNGKDFSGSDGKKVRVTTAESSYEGVVLGTYQANTGNKGEHVVGDVLPHVEQEDGTRTMPGAGECELLDE